MTQETGMPPQQPTPTGLEIAMQWADLPAEHLQIALKALEPQLRREHELRMEQQRAVQQLDLERMRLSDKEAQAKRSHALFMAGLIAGFVVAVGMLAGAVVVGVQGHVWLAAMLSGPSVLALAGLFVLRKTDSAQMDAVQRSQRSALNAAQQAPPAVDPAASPPV
ncbi:hypothetical protein ACFVW9_15210 [Streptomyces sp. NPDC058217]|uniref:hypothetical protein n=1 Tax=Streptomyces sp. NPDC058217 TaxID=3346384 RepID=UPI0036EEC224